MDWRIPCCRHNAVKEVAVYVAPRSELSRIRLNSDRGVQYRAIRYTERLAEAEAVASGGAKGDCLLTGQSVADLHVRAA